MEDKRYREVRESAGMHDIHPFPISPTSDEPPSLRATLPFMLG